MKQTIVLNTNSSIFMIRVGLAKHFQKYFRLTTSEEIKKEMEEGKRQGYKDAQMLLLLIEEKGIDVIPALAANAVAQNFNLELEDASVVALAEEQKSKLATEDTQVEKIALLKGLEVTNVGFLVYELFMKKELDKQRSLLILDILQQQGYRSDVIMKIKEKILGGV